MDTRGGVELDGIQAAVFPAVRGLSDASAVTTASTDSGASLGASSSSVLSPEVVVIDKKDPFSAVPGPVGRIIGQLGARRSSEWRRDLKQPTLSRVDDMDADAVPVPVSPKTPTMAQSLASEQAKARTGPNEDERPLCTLVVDDDK
jgi:hypothetical protein